MNVTRDACPIFSFSCCFGQKLYQTRMHSSRMRTVRSSSRLGGVCPDTPQTDTPRADTLHPWAVTPLGRHPPPLGQTSLWADSHLGRHTLTPWADTPSPWADTPPTRSPQLPPWVWAKTPPPGQISLNFFPGCGPRHPLRG